MMPNYSGNYFGDNTSPPQQFGMQQNQGMNYGNNVVGFNQQFQQYPDTLYPQQISNNALYPQQFPMMQNPEPAQNIMIIVQMPETESTNSLQTMDPNPWAQALPIDKINMLYNQYMVWFQFKSKRICAFDFVTGRWQMCPNKKNFELPEYFRVAQLPDYTFILTGGSMNDEIKNICLHYRDGDFVLKSGMEKARRAHSTIYNNGYVYVFGGLNNDTFMADCERYDCRQDRWQRIGDMGEARTLTTACNFGFNKIYVFGGYSGKLQKELDLIEELDLETLRFTRLHVNLHLPMQNPCVLQINDQEIVVMGGYNDKDGDLKDVYAYNLTNGKNKKLKDLPDGVWSMYPPYVIQDRIFLFATGEEDRAPDFFQYILQ